MRKYIILLGLLLVAAVSYSQSVYSVRASLDTRLDADKSQYYYKAPNLSVIDSVNNTLSLVLGVDNLFDLTKQYVKVKLDSISGSPATTVYLNAKHFWTDDWTGIDTVTWAGTEADTVFSVSNTTSNAYRFFNIQFVSDTAGNFQFRPTLLEFNVRK